jgi:hypothetical protein
MAAAACSSDKLVNITTPDVIPLPIATDPANIDVLKNGVTFEFARALTGPASNNSTPGIVGLSAVMTDEMWYSSTFTTMRDIDRRVIDVANTDLLHGYQYLHRARNLAEQAVAQYPLTPKNNSSDHAMVTNLAGFTYLFFAENFCSGVPFSTTSLNSAITYGPPLTTAQTLDSAIARFNAALLRATAANSLTQKNLAHLGLARALLDKDNFAAAAAEAAKVTDGFEFDIEYSANSSGQQNGVWWNNQSEGRSSAASLEGGNGLDFFSRGPSGTNTTDPRTPADSIGSGLGQAALPLYAALKYPSGDAPVPLGTTTEARLIQAENDLALGTSNTYLTTLNTLRAGIGLTPLVDPVTADGRVRQFFRERAFWLWMTAHRLGDLRRMIRDYGYTQAQVFPSGKTIRGGAYGTDVNLPIPFQEQNNPQFANGSCIDRNP